MNREMIRLEAIRKAEAGQLDLDAARERFMILLNGANGGRSRILMPKSNATGSTPAPRLEKTGASTYEYLEGTLKRFRSARLKTAYLTRPSFPAYCISTYLAGWSKKAHSDTVVYQLADLGG